MAAPQTKISGRERFKELPLKERAKQVTSTRKEPKLLPKGEGFERVAPEESAGRLRQQRFSKEFASEERSGLKTRMKLGDTRTKALENKHFYSLSNTSSCYNNPFRNRTLFHIFVILFFFFLILFIKLWLNP